MLFEARCLSKYSHLKVCTFLLELKPSDISPPLSQFQKTMFTKNDLFRLVLTINNQVSSQPSGKPLHPATLGIIFNHYWPMFENRINEITWPSDRNVMEIQSDIDVQLEEMLERLRGTRRNTTRIPEIQEPIPPDILSLTERRYFTLVNELGVSPQEAIKRIMKEMDKKYLLQIESRNMIFGHLMDFVLIKSHS